MQYMVIDTNNLPEAFGQLCAMITALEARIEELTTGLQTCVEVTANLAIEVSTLRTELETMRTPPPEEETEEEGDEETEEEEVEEV